MLSREEKRELLKIARDAITHAMHGKPHRSAVTVQGGLARPSGAFVTIRVGGELRGCIGYIESVDPLATVVADVAVKAAFDDPRFPPLTPGEFHEASLEVSVLSPMTQVKDISEIVVGVHGLLLELGPRRGLLLPQVASEYGWDRMEFLANVSRKAGLLRTAWSDPNARIFVFNAEVVGEEVDVTRGGHP